MNRLDLSSHRVQLFAAAAAASIVTATAITTYNSYTKRERRKHLNEDIKRSLASSLTGELTPPERLVTPDNARSLPMPSTGDHEYDEELIREQLARNYAFFGEEGMAKIRGGTVVIVGCGGVGSWAAVMLARSCVF
jgi:hypothetical protein